MAYVFLLFIIGFVSKSSAQLGGPSFSNDAASLYGDPFVTEKCEAKGIQYQELKDQYTSCVREAAVDNVSRYGRADTIVIMCRIRRSIRHCMEGFVKEGKKCYDTKEEKKEVESAVDIVDATFKYICADNARLLKELIKSPGSRSCIAKLPITVAQCKEDMFKEVHPRTFYGLSNEETCLAGFQAGRCMMEPLKQCSSKTPLKFYRGLLDVAFRASACKKYLVDQID